MRINQFVAAASGLSRRAADQAITSGRVTIAGQPAALGTDVSENDNILLDDQPLTLPTKHSYVMLNKPVGYVSSRVRQGADPTLYELLPPDMHNLRIAGRLDRDSSGLILLSDDGDFVHRHTHPSFGKQKVYELTLSSPLTPADIKALQDGVMLEDGPSRVTVLAHQGRDIQVSLGEGRNRQLRRTFGALGRSVERLHRTRMGTYAIGDLKPGRWTTVTPAETN